MVTVLRIFSLTALAVVLWTNSADAQLFNVCERLRAELGNAQARQSAVGVSGRNRRAVEQQRAELRQAQRLAKRRGCNQRSNRNSRRCRAIGGSIRAMQANLTKLERRAGRRGGNAGEIERIKKRMQRHNCYGQSRSAAVRRPRSNTGLFGLFNFDNGVTITRGYRRGSPEPYVQEVEPGLYGNFRTVCVRTCDGYFFPVSFSTTSRNFDRDAQQCASMCGGSETQLFVYRMPYETLEHARTVSGELYSSLPNALRYQREYVPGCTCQANQRTAILDAIRKERAAAESRLLMTSDRARNGAPPLEPTRDYVDVMSLPRPEVEPLLEAQLRPAKTDVRNVLDQPGVDQAAVPVKYKISFETFPPLPIKRPDPLDGKQLSLAQ